MKLKTLIVACVASVMMLAGCRSHKVIPEASYSTFQTTYVDAPGDGSLTLRAWGKGSDQGEAIEQAMRNAVNTVVFVGFREAPTGYQQPLVTEVNARERYASYFDPFFANQGEYRRFVNEVSRIDDSRLKSANKTATLKQYGVIVTVDVPALRQQLRNDGVIK